MVKKIKKTDCFEEEIFDFPGLEKCDHNFDILNKKPLVLKCSVCMKSYTLDINGSLNQLVSRKIFK